MSAKKKNPIRGAAKKLNDGKKKGQQSPVVDAAMFGPDKNPKVKGASKTPKNHSVGKGVKDKSEKAGPPPPVSMKANKLKNDGNRRKRNIGR